MSSLLDGQKGVSQFPINVFFYMRDSTVPVQLGFKSYVMSYFIFSLQNCVTCKQHKAS